MMKKYLLLFALAAEVLIAQGQTFFDKSYTIIQDITTARETSDGGFIASGTSTASGTYDMTMMKTDAAGNLQWMKTYGNASDNELAGAVIQTLDGGYLLGGKYPYAFLVKTDAAGVTQWHYKYNLDTQNGFQDIYEMPDSSYIMTYSSFGNAYRPGICRIDKNGTIVWTRELYTVSTNGTVLNNIIPLSNGDFLAVGLAMNSPTSPYESVLRFNSSGTIAWFMRYGYMDELYGGRQTSDGNVVICGSGGHAMKIDLNGNLLWRQKYTFSTHNITIHDIVENPSGELLLFAKAGTPAYPAIVIKTDASGNVITSRELVNITYPGSFTFSTNSILQPTSDGGYVLGTQNSLKKITPDLTSTCGIATLNITGAAEAIAVNNLAYTQSSGGAAFVLAFSELPLASVTTSYCSTIILSASASSTNPACNGQCTGTATVTAAGGQAPYTYSWSPGGQTTASVSNLCAGTYTVTVTDANSSVITSTVTITQPSAITVGASAVTSTFCAGGCTDLNSSASGGTPGYTYLWMPGGMTSATPNVCPGASTTYTCTVTDANSCAQNDSVLVTVNALPNVTAGIDDSICAGNSANLTSGGASTYAWNPGNLPGSSVTVSPGATTTYTVTGTDVNGCTNTATTTITVHALPNVSYVESQTTACVNWTPITLSAGSPAGGMYSGTAVTGNSFDPAAAGSGTYDIVYTFTDSNGCAASDTSQLTVDLCTAISEAGAMQLEIYPNPFSATITAVTNAAQARIELYNALGEMVYVTQARGPETKIALDELSRGIYFIRLVADEGSVTRKLFKE